MTNRSSLWIKCLFTFSGVALATLSFTDSSSQKLQSNIPQIDSSDSNSGSQEGFTDFRKLVKKATPAVVSIKVQGKKNNSSFGRDDKSDDSLDLFENDLRKFFNFPKDAGSKQLSGQASGVIVSPDGYILTNNHVVNEMSSITVQLNDGREFPAKVLGTDSNSDLAVIKIDATDLPFLTLGNSDNIEPGEWVVAIGNPYGLQATVTKGIVSAKGRNNLDIIPYADFIQTDAALNAGNSGGPLLNLKGEIIGINTAIATNTSSGYLGIGFAIPSNWANFVMNEILTNGKVSRGFLGVTLQSVDYNLAQAFDLKKVEGALVTIVMKDSPSDKAGIKTEDIILKINDQPVINAASLRNSVYMMHPTTKITLTVLRDGKMLSIPVEVGAFSEDAEPIAKEHQSNALGIEVETLTPDLARNLGNKIDTGVVVTKVQPGSPAAYSGIKKGAVILSINRQKVETKEQFYTALKSTQEGRPALFQIKQGDVNAFVSIQIQ